MTTTQASCPACQVNLKLRKALAVGTTLKCPKCGSSFLLSRGEGGAMAPATAVGPSLLARETASDFAGPRAGEQQTIDQAPDEGVADEEAISLNFLRPAEKPDELGRLGHFRVLKELGRGGMGMVFLAEDLQLFRQVALKVMLPQHAAKPQFKERFLREARTAASIDNDHIIAIYEVAEDHGVPYLSMPVLKGEALSDRLKRDQRPPLAEVLRIAWQICDGLQAAHDRGLVHRDLKPANVWLEDRSQETKSNVERPVDRLAVSRCRVKILDFGLARAVNTDVHLTRTGVVLGTPSYMAPEQARNPNVDALADLFSLGVILYQMTTGKLPFHGHDAMSMMLAICNDVPAHAAASNPDLPKELNGLIMKLLAKKPDKRYASAHQVALALEAIDAKHFQGQAISGPSLVSASLPVAKPVAPSGKEQPPKPNAFAFDDAANTGKPPVIVNRHTDVASVAKKTATPPAPTNTLAHADPGNAGKRTFLLALAAGLLGIFALCLLGGITIYIRNKDGTITEIKLPKDAGVEIKKDGKTIVKIDPKTDPPPEKKTPPAVAATDPHRRAAEMVLKHGGKVVVQSAAGWSTVTRGEDLPAGPFVIGTADLAKRELSDDAMEAFAGVYYISGNLRLYGANLTDRGVKHLRDLSVASLLLGDNAITDESIKLLADERLVTLQFGNTSITDAAVPHFKKMANLRYLHIGGTKITDSGLKELAGHRSLRTIFIGKGITAQGLAHLKGLPALREIGLSSDFGDEVIEALSGITQLRLVNILGSKVTPDGALRLQKALPNAVVMHSAVAPTAAERDAIQWALEQKATISAPYHAGVLKEVPKTAFYVTGLIMPEGGPKSGASKLRGLRSIDALSWSGLTDADAEAEHLATLDSLIRLKLENTNLSAKGMECLTALKQLEQLQLSSNKTITDDALRHLPAFEHLQLLYLGDTQITDAGMEHLGRVRGLQNLALGYCPKLTGTGLKHLATLPVLRELSLQGTPIDDTAVASLKLLSSLRILHLHGTKLTAAGIAELQKALPKCAIFWDGGVVIPGATTAK